MSDSDQRKQPHSTRKAVAIDLGIAAALAAIALLGTIRAPKSSAHYVWPIHSDYLLPILAMMFAYFALAILVLTAVLALFSAAKEDR